MNRILRATILALALLSGCVHTATVRKGPDASAMLEHSRKMAAAVTAAKAHVQQAGAALVAAEKSTNEARSLLDIILPKLDALSLDTPAEMKLAVADIQADMSSLRSLLDDSKGGNATARAELTGAANKLEEATAEKNLTQTATEKYQADTEAIVTERNELDAKYAKDSKALAYYRLHWFLGWCVLGAGVLGCVLLSFLKATGRLAIAARPI